MVTLNTLNPNIAKAPLHSEAFARDEVKTICGLRLHKLLALVALLFFTVWLVLGRALLTFLWSIRFFSIWVFLCVRHGNLLFVKIGFSNVIRTIGLLGLFPNKNKTILNFKNMGMV